MSVRFRGGMEASCTSVLGLSLALQVPRDKPDLLYSADVQQRFAFLPEPQRQS